MKTDEQEVINFLLTTEIIPLCLRIMESGSELSKTVCTFNLLGFLHCGGSCVISLWFWDHFLPPLFLKRLKHFFSFE